MLRAILGIVAGAAVCNLGFRVLAFGMLQLWPAFAVHGHTYLQEHRFTFPAGMAVCILLLWIMAASAAGFIAMRIARDWRAAQLLAALIVMAAAGIHLVLQWSQFPWWYNIAVVLQMGPAVLLGARMSRPN